MDFKKIIKEIEKSAEFKKWKNENSKAYLAHAFIMTDQQGNGEWQVGYYNPENELMTKAIIAEGKVDLKCEEVFKKPDSKVGKLNLAKVKIDHPDAGKLAEELRKKTYTQELPLKTIAILQNIDNYGQVWNMTYFTMKFNTLNIKIDAETGEVKHHELSQLMKFDKC